MTDNKKTRRKTALSASGSIGRKVGRGIKEAAPGEGFRRKSAASNSRGAGRAAKSFSLDHNRQKSDDLRADAAIGPQAKTGGRRWPVIEVVLVLLLLKIGAGAWMLMAGPDMADQNSGAAISFVKAEKTEEQAVLPLLKEAAKVPAKSVVSAVDSYLAAAMEAVSSPSVAQASTTGVAAAGLSIAPIASGAMSLVYGQSASAPMAQGGEVEPIPLPPGVDLLSPAAELPPPNLPTLGSGIGSNQTTGQTPRSGGAAPLPPNTAPVAPGLNQDVLRQREQALAVKEAELASREEALKALDADIRQRMSAIENFRNEHEAMISRNEAVLAEMKALREEQKKEDEIRKDASLQQLVAAYGAMKPEQAGALVNSLDDDVAVSILSIMPGRKAGMILANVIPEKAARLTKAISERRIDPNLILSDNPAGSGLPAMP